MNTHAGVHQALSDIPRDERNLENITIGVNYRPKRNIAIKTNYQIRTNKYQHGSAAEANRFEIGVGLIY